MSDPEVLRCQKNNSIHLENNNSIANADDFSGGGDYFPHEHEDEIQNDKKNEEKKKKKNINNSSQRKTKNNSSSPAKDSTKSKAKSRSNSLKSNNIRYPRRIRKSTSFSLSQSVRSRAPSKQIRHRLKK